jgi:hypothetical protein
MYHFGIKLCMGEMEDVFLGHIRVDLDLPCEF